MFKSSSFYNLLFFCALLAGYFAFTDLQISMSIVSRQSTWAEFLQRFGELPGLLVLFSGTHIYLSGFQPASQLRKIFVFVFLYCAAIYLSRYIFITIYSGVTDNYYFLENYRWSIILTLIVLNLVISLPFRRLFFSERILKFAKVSVLLGFFGYLLTVQPIKQIWGRVRFRDLDQLYSNFTPWFVANGINGNESMPSGHSAMSWMLLPLLILIPAKNKKLRALLLLLIFAWGFTVGLSRIIIGAHYASDVLFGACIVIVIFAGIKNRLEII